MGDKLGPQQRGRNDANLTWERWRVMYTYNSVHQSLGGIYMRNQSPIGDVGVVVMQIESNVFQCYIFSRVITRLHSILKLSSSKT